MVIINGRLSGYQGEIHQVVPVFRYPVEELAFWVGAGVDARQHLERVLWVNGSDADRALYLRWVKAGCQFELRQAGWYDAGSGTVAVFLRDYATVDLTITIGF